MKCLLIEKNQNKHFDGAFFVNFVIVYMKMIINFWNFLLEIFLDYYGPGHKHITKGEVEFALNYEYELQIGLMIIYGDCVARTHNVQIRRNQHGDMHVIIIVFLLNSKKKCLEIIMSKCVSTHL